MLIAAPFLSLLGAPAGAGAPALVIGAPWTDIEGGVLRAGGRLIGVSSAPMGALAVFESAGFDERLRMEGLLFAFDGRIMASLCRVSLPE